MGYNFIELVDTRLEHELFNEKGKPQALPRKLRPETEGSELWIRITKPEEYMDMYPAPRWSDSTRLDELYVAVHVSDKMFSRVHKYAEIRDAIVDHYLKDGRWYKVISKLDMKPSESKDMSVYKVVFLVEQELRETVTFDFNTKDIEYKPIELASKEVYEGYDAKQLRRECILFDLKTSGSKSDLVRYLEEERVLQDSLNKESPKPPEDKLNKESPKPPEDKLNSEYKPKSVPAYKKMNKVDLLKECELLELSTEDGTNEEIASRIISRIYPNT